MKGTSDSVAIAEGHNILDLSFAIAHHPATGKISAVYRSGNVGDHNSFLASTEFSNGVWGSPIRIGELDTRIVHTETLAHCYAEDEKHKRYVFRVADDDTIHMRSETPLGAIWKDHGSITKEYDINDRTKLAATSIPAHGGTILLYHVNSKRQLTERWGIKTIKGIEWKHDSFTGIQVDVTGQMAVTTIGGKAYIVFTASDRHCEGVAAEFRGALCLVVRDPMVQSGWGQVHILAASSTFSVETAVSITAPKGVSNELTVCYLSEGSAAWTIQVNLKGAVVPRTDKKGNLLGPERISRLTGYKSLAAIPGSFSGTSFLFALTTLHGTKTLMTYTKAASAECVTTMTQRLAVQAWLKEEIRQREIHVTGLCERSEAKKFLRVELELKLKAIQSEEKTSVDEYHRARASYEDAQSELMKTTTSLVTVTQEVETAKVCQISSVKNAKWSIHDTIKTELRVIDSCGNAKAVC
ncbi:hypothetical protein Q9L58_007412 [Maublancomyces gigas]|uniref:Fucose-specific lectin n=1 Tax=Discina gigas TaxID=1032678 RepID=A0ABR3GCN8_9PEZI